MIFASHRETSPTSSFFSNFLTKASLAPFACLLLDSAGGNKFFAGDLRGYETKI